MYTNYAACNLAHILPCDITRCNACLLLGPRGFVSRTDHKHLSAVCTNYCHVCMSVFVQALGEPGLDPKRRPRLYDPALPYIKRGKLQVGGMAIPCTLPTN